MDDLINRLQARKVFNGNTTIRRDGPGCPWVEERQTVTDPLCDQAAAALTEAQATIARLEAALRETTAWMEEMRASGDAGFWDWGPDDAYTRARAALSPGKGE